MPLPLNLIIWCSRLRFWLIPYVFALLVISCTSTQHVPPPLQSFSYSQPVDHFGFGNLSQIRFQQRFFIDCNYLGRIKTHYPPPIFVYLGGEAPIENWIDVNGDRIARLAARHFQGLVIYIEHRFYGDSVPFHSIDIAMSDQEVRGCLTSEQALADFAEIIIFLKINSSSYTLSPIFAIGGSYAGMLSAWFRLKYPHIISGALSSSAPVISPINVPPQDRFCAIVSKDFMDISEKCVENIRHSWKIIEDIGSTRQGLDELSRLFRTCSPLLRTNELKTFLTETYNFAAQYDGRFKTRTRELCNEIDMATSKDQILPSIARGISAEHDKGLCMNLTMIGQSATIFGVLDPVSQKAWDWQLCSELLPPGGCDNNSMFVPSTFNTTEHMQNCWERYGVYPHPNWMTTYYGGQDMKSALKEFGSNIIFSNGLRDPLSGAGILHDISDTIMAITTTRGSHCLDLNPIREDDPDWLKQQRRKELEVIAEWIKDAQSSCVDMIRPVTFNSPALTLVVATLLILMF